MQKNRNNNYGKKGKTDFYMILHIPKGHRTYRALLCGRDPVETNKTFELKFKAEEKPIVYKIDGLTGLIIKF